MSTKVAPKTTLVQPDARIETDLNFMNQIWIVVSKGLDEGMTTEDIAANKVDDDDDDDDDD